MGVEDEQFPKPEDAIFIATVKYARLISQTYWISQASFFVAMDPTGQIVLAMVIGKPNDTDIRRYTANYYFEPEELPLFTERDVRRELAYLLGDRKWLVGWNLAADLDALMITVPDVQCVDLATDPIARTYLGTMLSQTPTAELETNASSTVAISLPFATWKFTKGRIDLRRNSLRANGISRNPIRDVNMIRQIWRSAGDEIVRH